MSAAPSEDLRELAAEQLDLAAEGPVLPVPPVDVSKPVLSIDDLIRDDNGEVVLYNDSGVRSLGIAAEAAVVERGQAEEHVTAAGADVTGFRYLTFENGLTLYYEDGLNVILESPAS